MTANSFIFLLIPSLSISYANDLDSHYKMSSRQWIQHLCCSLSCFLSLIFIYHQRFIKSVNSRTKFNSLTVWIFTLSSLNFIKFYILREVYFGAISICWLLIEILGSVNWIVVRLEFWNISIRSIIGMILWMETRLKLINRWIGQFYIVVHFPLWR